MNKKFKQGIIGFITIYIVMSLMSGDVTSALAIIFMSILCTAGLGFILWIPFSIVVGAIVEAIWENISRMTKGKSGSTENAALINFIQKARTNGLSENQIAQKLLDAGWPKDAISNKLNI